jgi:NAD(P)-dependent dehydrogenase (short-subunit alcohol dehydrogenase family)
MTFAGKQAIVTGAGSGIGAALSRALVAAGADVVCTDVDGAAAARTAESLKGPAPRPRPPSTSPTRPRWRPPSTPSSPAPDGST